MPKTKLSSKGQVIIPKSIRSRHNWDTGQELTVIDTEEGILLKPVQLFKETQIDQVAGILQYNGSTISLDEMEAAIKKGAREHNK